MSRSILVVAATMAALVGAAALAAPSWAGGSSSRSVTFGGNCQFSGTSSFSSLVTVTPSPVHNQVAASGTCTGTLTSAGGRSTSVSNAPVRYRASEFGASESCAADPDATGTGELLFAHGTLRFAVVENRVSGQAALAYTGRRAGSASGVAYVSSPDPAGLLAQCATSGISSAPVAIVFETTPSISG